MAVDPGQLAIVSYPHPSLRTRAGAVAEITPEVRAVAERMIELMRQEEGIGLAAPQVGLPWRLFVAEVPEDEERSASSDPATATGGPVVYVNPRVVAHEGEQVIAEEGCLSLPEISGDVARPPVVTIEATDLEGRTAQHRAGGLLARCWQHEIDHLDGVLIIDKMQHLSRIKNRRLVRDLEKQSTA